MMNIKPVPSYHGKTPSHSCACMKFLAHYCIIYSNHIIFETTVICNIIERIKSKLMTSSTETSKAIVEELTQRTL